MCAGVVEGEAVAEGEALVEGKAVAAGLAVGVGAWVGVRVAAGVALLVEGVVCGSQAEPAAQIKTSRNSERSEGERM